VKAVYSPISLHSLGGYKNFVLKFQAVSAINVRCYFLPRPVYILLVLMYSADVWSLIMASERCLDAFDQWCLQHILYIPYTAHVSNSAVCRRTGQSLVTTLIKEMTRTVFPCGLS